MILFFTVTVLIVLLDQLTKQLAVGYLRDNHGSIALVGDWLKLTYTENSGIAFGVTLGSQYVLVAMTVLILFALLLFVYFSKNRAPVFLTTFGLILGGGIGNLIDRATVGRVVDFIHFDLYQGYLFGTWTSLWPVFNLADSAITVGACILVFRYKSVFKEH